LEKEIFFEKLMIISWKINNYFLEKEIFFEKLIIISWKINNYFLEKEKGKGKSIYL
jgi:hypothetical protein